MAYPRSPERANASKLKKHPPSIPDPTPRATVLFISGAGSGMPLTTQRSGVFEIEACQGTIAGCAGCADRCPQSFLFAYGAKAPKIGMLD